MVTNEEAIIQAHQEMNQISANISRLRADLKIELDKQAAAEQRLARLESEQFGNYD